MTKTLFSVTAIFLCLLMHAQPPVGKSSLSINTGPAFTLNPFGNTDAGNSESGFARSGPHMALTYTTSLQKKWSLVTTLQIQQHRLNTTALEKEFSATPIASGLFTSTGSNMPLPGSAYKTYHNWNFEKKSWLAGFFLVGAQLNSVSTKKWQPYIRLQAGLVYLRLPAIKGESVTDTSSAYLDQKGSSGNGWGYNSTAGMYHRLNQKIFLTAAISYIGSARVNFSNVRSRLTTTQRRPGDLNYSIQQSTATGSASQKISSLNISVGIGLTW
ncbi:MAG: hypothetical protein KA821_01830 [Chitinophagaceae bacterium]|nr:hypothetical protein [Chitinophagaceae bacterium]